MLPIPGNLQDSNSVAYKQSSLNALQLAAAEDINDFITGIKDKKFDDSSLVKTFRDVKLGDNLNRAKSLIGSKAAAAALNIPGGASAFLARTSGIILNPNMELLFDSPTLRSLDSRSNYHQEVAQRARQVISIIRFLKELWFQSKRG